MSVNDHPDNMAETIARLREENERERQGQRLLWVKLEAIESRLALARKVMDVLATAIRHAGLEHIPLAEDALYALRALKEPK